MDRLQLAVALSLDDELRAVQLKTFDMEASRFG
jgi:hypothetical protein